MKAELIFPQELVDQISNNIIEKLKPVSLGNGKSDTDKFLTPEELSNLLQVKKSQIYAWVNESKYVDDGIPFLKAGKFLRFSQIAVLKWMERHKNR